MMTDRRPLLHQVVLIEVENGKRLKNTAGVICHEEHIRHGNGRLIVKRTASGVAKQRLALTSHWRRLGSVDWGPFAKLLIYAKRYLLRDRLISLRRPNRHFTKAHVVGLESVVDLNCVNHYPIANLQIFPSSE
jgi:hypothetical protein